MNLFASDRIEPSNIKFPKGFDKLEWTVAKTYEEFCALYEKNDVKNVVIDSSAKGNNLPLRFTIGLTEITCDKHIKLPTLLVVGTNESAKKSIQEHLAKAKRWIEINSSRGR